MAVKSKSEILDNIKAIVGDNNDETVLTLLENISDTFADFESKSNDTENWREKYEENDRAWRERYTKRFYDGQGESLDLTPDKPEGVEIKSFDDLFKEM